MEDKIQFKIITEDKMKSRYSEEEKKKYDSLRKQKERMLKNIVFPSMANLVVFFEYLRKNAELREDFEDDVKELFGYIKKPWDRNAEDQNEYNIRNRIIRRLISSLFTWDRKNDPNNFRLDMIGDLQMEIMEIITSLAREDFAGGFSVSDIVNTDMGRAVTWAKLYAKRYTETGAKQKKVKKAKPSKPIAF